MANWDYFLVSDSDFQGLVENNKPISTSEFSKNQGVALYSEGGKMLNAVYDANMGAIRKIKDFNPVFPSAPNRDLALYNDFLLNEDINTVIVDGIFGTGKTSTLCAHVVGGLKKSMRGDLDIGKVYISKPHEGLGKGYGFLPGDLMDKTSYEFMSYYQYFDRFAQPGFANKLMSIDALELIVFEYLRGRDLDSGWVILDEAQNTDRKEMISFLSRVGDGAKLVILGDSSNYQIDKKGNSNENNGLYFTKELLSSKKYCGVVEMDTASHILRGNRVKDLYLSMKVGGIDGCTNKSRVGLPV